MENNHNYLLQAGQIFTLFFIMLGPMRILAPFSMVSMSLERSEKQKLALKSALIAAFTLIIAGFLGSMILAKWHVSPATLLLAAGFHFFISAIHPFVNPTQKTIESNINLTPQDIALNMVISPYGLATVIVLFALSHDVKRLLTIIGCLIAVLIIDMVAMALSKPNIKKKESLFSKILHLILATLQFALALQIVIVSLRELGILEAN